jgi:hypothetical protein
MDEEELQSFPDLSESETDDEQETLEEEVHLFHDSRL